MAQFDLYKTTFEAHYNRGLRDKLGLREERPEDPTLTSGLLERMAADRRDYTNTWRLLAGFDSTPGAANARLRDHFIDRAAFDAWASDYAARLRAEQSDDAQRRAAMNQINPKYVLRNYLAQIAIDRARDQRDYSEIDRLLRVLQDPYAEHPKDADLAEPPPDWGRRLSVSCSS
jgi:serine/tyrosine/threonine adenylyltransferase